MIIVKRLTGQQFAINPDLLGRIESTPDTILVLLDGTRYIVDQTVDEVIDLIREYRASVISQALAAPGGGTLSDAPRTPTSAARRSSGPAQVVPIPGPGLTVPTPVALGATVAVAHDHTDAPAATSADAESHTVKES